MKQWFTTHKITIISIVFLIPILLTSIISISHITRWYSLTNPLSWATYLSVAIECAALAATASLTVGMRKFIYLPFGIVTLVQLLGNIFYCFLFIDVNSHIFKQWVDLVSPFFNMMGFDSTDLITQKRILATLAGGLLPLISLTFLHMLIISSDKKPVPSSGMLDLEGAVVKEPEITMPEPFQFSQEHLERLEQILEPKVPQPSQTPSPTPTLTPSASLTVTATLTPTPSMTMQESETPTPTPTPTPQPSASLTPTLTPTLSPTPEEMTPSPFTRVGEKLKKAQYENPDRRRL